MTAPAAEASHLTKGLVRLTMACNERCPFCNVPAEDFPTQPTPEAALHAAVEATLAAGQRTLTISGGEPTLLRGRLLALVRHARGRGLDFVELQTNAILIDPGYARALAEAGLTSAFVSLLSHVPAHHDALAGLAGAFPRCLRGLDALAAAGVALTLNPVVAALTQDLLPDYVDFVAARLPAVRAISVSAVQPHGRAARDLDLLPDYARLAASVREARRRARARGLTLINPYCGLPLCVGWHDLDPDERAVCVESIEGEHAALGLDNLRNKAHGPPCRGCALRTRCGGAWHAVWARGGRGIAAPLTRVVPWDLDVAGITEDEARAVLGAPRPGPEGLAALAEARAPTRWLRCEALPEQAMAPLAAGAATDLLLLWRPEDRASLQRLRALLKGQEARLPRARLRAAVWLRARGSEAARVELARLLAAMGVDALRLDLSPPTRAALARALPEVDLVAGGPP